MGEKATERDSDNDRCLANQLFMEPKKIKVQCQVLNKLGAYRGIGFRLLLLIPSLLSFLQFRISFPVNCHRIPQNAYQKARRKTMKQLQVAGKMCWIGSLFFNRESGFSLAGWAGWCHILFCFIFHFIQKSQSFSKCFKSFPRKPCEGHMCRSFTDYKALYPRENWQHIRLAGWILEEDTLFESAAMSSRLECGEGEGREKRAVRAPLQSWQLTFNQFYKARK